MYERLPVLLKCRQLFAKGGHAYNVAAFDHVAQLLHTVEKERVELDGPLQLLSRAVTGALNVEFS